MSGQLLWLFAYLPIKLTMPDICSNSCSMFEVVFLILRFRWALFYDLFELVR